MGFGLPILADTTPTQLDTQYCLAQAPGVVTQDMEIWNVDMRLYYNLSFQHFYSLDGLFRIPYEMT